MTSPSSGANFAPWPEQGEATTNGPCRSRMKSSFPVQVYKRGAFGVFVPDGKYEVLCSYGANNGAQAMLDQLSA